MIRFKDIKVGNILLYIGDEFGKIYKILAINMSYGLSHVVFNHIDSNTVFEYTISSYEEWEVVITKKDKPDCRKINYEFQKCK